MQQMSLQKKHPPLQCQRSSPKHGNCRTRHRRLSTSQHAHRQPALLHCSQAICGDNCLRCVTRPSWCQVLFVHLHHWLFTNQHMMQYFSVPHMAIVWSHRMAKAFGMLIPIPSWRRGRLNTPAGRSRPVEVSVYRKRNVCMHGLRNHEIVRSARLSAFSRNHDRTELGSNACMLANYRPKRWLASQAGGYVPHL